MKADARASQQFLLLSHLYSQKADAAALARLRKELLRPKYTAMELALGSIVGVSAVGGITNCSITLFSCLVCLLPCTIKCQSAWHSLCRLPDITKLLSSRGTKQIVGKMHHTCTWASSIEVSLLGMHQQCVPILSPAWLFGVAENRHFDAIREHNQSKLHGDRSCCCDAEPGSG